MTLFIEESELQDMIERHEIDSLMDGMNISFFEEGDSEKTQGFFSKIIEKLSKLLEKIGNIFSSIIEGFKSLGTGKKKRLTAEEFLNSETGQAKLMADFDKIGDQIDAEYRAARPIIQNISKITKIDDSVVEAWCDNLNEKVAQVYDENKTDIKNEAMFLARQKSAEVVGKKLSANSKKIQQCKEETKKHLDALNARKEADGAKKELNKIDKVAASLMKVGKKWYKAANTVMKFI